MVDVLTMFDEFLGKNISDVIRIFYPKTMVTDDCVGKRLNIVVDDAGKITQMYFG